MNGNSRDILGAVLAGGRSSRMGRDKAGLLMGQDTFLARALRAVRSVCPEAVISLRPDAPCRAAAEKAGKTVWDDGLHGPMGGLAACLEEAGKSGFTAVLACACDMPLLSADVLEIVCRARGNRPSGTLVTAPLLPGRKKPEPLCAVWETAALPDIRAALAEGRLSLFRALPLRAWHILPCPVSLAAELSNVNTPDELAALETSGNEAGPAPSRQGKNTLS